MQGAKIVPLLMSVSIGLALRFLVPPPIGVTMQAWTLLSIFVSTIAGGPEAVERTWMPGVAQAQVSVGRGQSGVPILELQCSSATPCM